MSEDPYKAEDDLGASVVIGLGVTVFCAIVGYYVVGWLFS